MEKRTETPTRANCRRLAEIPLSRRTALALGTAASLAIAANTPGIAVATGSGGGLEPVNDFDELRQRWQDYILGVAGLGVPSPAVAQRYRSLSSYATWAYGQADHYPDPGDDIWSDLAMRGPQPANITTTYRRILKITTAWATPSTDQYQDDEMERTLVRWYRYMIDSWYHAGAEHPGNWWFWEIGIPRVLGDLTLLLQNSLAQSDIDDALEALRSFTPDPNRIVVSGYPSTGANRAEKILACLLRGVAGESPQDMSLARDALLDTEGDGENGLLSYSTSGDGFYLDGSYIHHLYIPYAGSYGKAALAAVAPAIMLIEGTQWDLPIHLLRPILNSPGRTFAPFIWNGRMMETVRGRTVAREHERDYNDTWGTAEAVMLLAQHVPEPFHSRYQAHAKAWLSRCSEGYNPTSTSDLRRAEDLLQDDSVEPTTEQPGHVQYNAQERMVHRGDGWAFTVATSSERIGRYGWGNGENRFGWHQGDGASYLYVESDHGQFADDYWPTVDPYRLPGTTASLAEREPGPSSGTPVPRAANRWGGGVELARRWGTAGMDLTNDLGDLRAKKSWFLLDDSIVAVGSGIVVTGPGAETTIENRSFPAGAAPGLVVDGDPIAVGDSTGLDAPRWAHLDGVAGYVLLGTYAARASVAERSGSWYDINIGGDTAGSRTVQTRTYATLSLTHPSGTGGDRYRYMILPGASEATTREHASSTTTEVLRDDPRAHVVRAVRGARWFLFAHVFDAVDDGLVRADHPCAVLASWTRWGVRIAVSDPSRSDSQVSIGITLPDPYPKPSFADRRLTVTPAGKDVEIVADLDGAEGASFEAALNA
ncbi:polysaccharide lyase 8 family protein [Myceligenerans indicum]|uniref:Polysaccharide lyase 8 family protein n=1 Tax=Myceligenerans indicum TaxID=2593663 RepID=A0ABS1LQJ7_9MICO|nr:polysaccharide lyase 8 family protein [Myceligenerans indicum]MBL0888535.1 polysaccharide lyase 8 family protein [Myceligenerans indicum]